MNRSARGRARAEAQSRGDGAGSVTDRLQAPELSRGLLNLSHQGGGAFELRLWACERERLPGGCCPANRIRSVPQPFGFSCAHWRLRSPCPATARGALRNLSSICFCRQRYGLCCCLSMPRVAASAQLLAPAASRQSGDIDVQSAQPLRRLPWLPHELERGACGAEYASARFAGSGLDTGSCSRW